MLERLFCVDGVRTGGGQVVKERVDLRIKYGQLLPSQVTSVCETNRKGWAEPLEKEYKSCWAIVVDVVVRDRVHRQG